MRMLQQLWYFFTSNAGAPEPYVIMLSQRLDQFELRLRELEEEYNTDTVTTRKKWKHE